ncbi:MAG: COX15/CtaA family protein [Actinobacteria bacterium]|nr:COX15/CtaA family protein [Actinomycetota bacterium]
MTHTPRALRRLSIATVVVTYLLVVLGDTVRVTQSGMGCRSWPLCNGNLGLVGNYHAMLEQSHRYLAAVVTVFVVVTFLVARRQARHDRTVRAATVASLVMIAIQVPLGAITVFAHNAGWTVAMHLAGAWLVVAAVTTTMVAVMKSTRSRSLPAGRGVAQALARPVGVSIVVVFMVAVAGMLVLHDGATLSCPSWPLCAGSIGSLGVMLQYIHRSIALLAGAALVWLTVCTWRLAGATALQRNLSVVTLGLLMVTAAFGAIVATTGAPEYAQDIHLALASGLWLSLVALASDVMLPQRAGVPGDGGQTGTSGLGREPGAEIGIDGVASKVRRTAETAQ